ncbi:MAG TPA: FG-GAP-like repeat-containing protein, partial [Friedmanniella sp.]
GDFDGDGYADLAVGHPGERVAGASQAGAVTVLFGTRHGLTGSRSVQLVEPGGGRPGARFGAALAVVDLDRDGRSDLAVGAPGDVPRGSTAAQGSGSVTVLRGSESGLTTDGSTVLRGTVGGPSTNPDVAFGTALAVGGVDEGPGADLIVASSGIGGDGSRHAGSVAYCASGAQLPATCLRLLHDDSMAGATQVVVGHFVYPHIDQPIVLGPEIVLGSVQDGSDDDGAVLLLRVAESRDGNHPYVLDSQVLSRANLGQPVGPGSRADFGASLAVGDVIGDDLGNTFDDLVVGAPGEQVDGRSAGRVFVIPGGPRNLEPSHLLAFDEETPGVPGRAASGDRFGGSVAVGDRDGDGKADLVIGSPGKDQGRGSVTVLHGTGLGFDTAGAESFSLATFGRRQHHTGFGSVLGG